MAKEKKEYSKRPKVHPRHLVRMIVKFHDYVDLPYEDSVERHFQKKGIGPWNPLVEKYPGLTFRRYFSALQPDALRKLMDRGQETDPSYKAPNLLNWFAVEAPAQADIEEVVRAIGEWRTVEAAYVEPAPTPPPAVAAANDPRWPNQGYLDPAPDGIDAEYAWTIAGGDGAGIGFVDLEQGWNLNHEDLADHEITLISGWNNNSWNDHGNAVLGVVAAVDNDIGCVGITPNLASIQVVSEAPAVGVSNVGDAILSALDVMDFGDVLLLETQESGTVAGHPGFGNVPSEAIPAYFDTIRLATALGIIVVEAAGNNNPGQDLDTFTNASGLHVLDRTSVDFRESGAIMVGAAVSSVPHERGDRSNHGSRIDCYAWGENIDTLNTSSYQTDFNGTSGASAIIAGAALAVQGLAQANLGYRFSPLQVRALLSDPALGTPSADPPTDRIGIMPNLRALIEGNRLNLAPDIYLRDFVGDNGDPHSNAISASPDVILRPIAVADPQGSFGEGSGTENDNTLGFEAEAGQDNFLHVRVRNRGGSAAADVHATVYWSPVATLLTSDLWNLVGSVTLPNVPVGDVLTVSDAIPWPAANIPAPGHYCFVGLIGLPQDPTPNPADFLDWDNYRTFIRSNNNVTWRNFNVVDNAPAPGAEPRRFVSLPFLAPGAPDRTRHMVLEIVAKLPAGARAQLELPIYWMDMLKLRNPKVQVDPKGHIARVAINAHGTERFGPIPFPAKSRTALRLLVHIPEESRKNPSQIYARQLFAEEEVGRVTWRLSPRR